MLLAYYLRPSLFFRRWKTIGNTFRCENDVNRIKTTAVALLAAALFGSTTFAADVSGTLDADASWIVTGSPYIVTDDVTVAAGVTLTLDAGVTVRFAAGASLIVNGHLQALGAEKLPVTFTSDQAVPAPGDWGAIEFPNANTQSLLQWCVIEYGSYGIVVDAGPGVSIAPEVRDSIIRYHLNDGVYVKGYVKECDSSYAQPVLERCVIENNGASGINYVGSASSTWGCFNYLRYSFAGGEVTDCDIRNNGGSGVRMYTRTGFYGSNTAGISNAVITNSRIHGNIEDGIRMTGYRSSAEIEGCRIWDNGVNGILVDTSYAKPRVRNTYIYENTLSGISWTNGAENAVRDLHGEILYNVLHGNNESGLHCENTGCDRLRVVGNLVTANGGYGVDCDGVTDLEIYTHNDAFNNAGGNVYQCNDAGDGNISVYPRDYYPDDDDFRLMADSTAIDAGEAVYCPPGDINGIVRPIDGPDADTDSQCDLGPFEFGAPQVGLAVPDGTDPVEPEATFSYTITLSNVLFAPATGVVVTAEYDSNVSFGSADPEPDAGTDNVWTLATLGPEETETITVTVSADAGLSPAEAAFITASVVFNEGTHPAVTHSTAVSRRGDFNLDNAVDPVDAAATLATCAHRTPYIHLIADTNNDGKAGIIDSVYILQRRVGLR